MAVAARGAVGAWGAQHNLWHDRRRGPAGASFGETITSLLREARSLSRRADKLGSTAAAVDDPATQQLAAEACTSMEQLVHHLMVLERQAQRGEKSAARRR
jgi:hypothetical protein